MDKQTLAMPRITGRIPILDGLRGIAVLAVMHYHFMLIGVQHEKAFWDRLYFHIAGIGWVGVDLFFVLSGFLITGILYDSREDSHYYRVFFARRTVRIFPLYYASLALFIFLSHLYSVPPLLAPSESPSAAPWSAWTYTLNWRMGLHGWGAVPPALQHFWSLSIEEQFYLFWPLFVRTFSRERLIKICQIMVVAALALRFAFAMYMVDSTAAYVLTVSRMDALAIGGMVALAARDRVDWEILVKWWKPITSLAGAGVLWIIWISKSTGNGVFWMKTVGLSLIAVFLGGCLVAAIGSRESSVAHRLTSSGVFQFFGKYSYCLYICHQPLILILAGLGINSANLSGTFHNRALAIVAVNVIAMTMAVCISLVMWHFFEKHFLKLKRFPLFQYNVEIPRKVHANGKTGREFIFAEPITQEDAGA